MPWGCLVFILSCFWRGFHLVRFPSSLGQVTWLVSTTYTHSIIPYCPVLYVTAWCFIILSCIDTVDVILSEWRDAGAGMTKNPWQKKSLKVFFTSFLKIRFQWMFWFYVTWKEEKACSDLTEDTFCKWLLVNQYQCSARLMEPTDFDYLLFPRAFDLVRNAIPN